MTLPQREAEVVEKYPAIEPVAVTEEKYEEVRNSSQTETETEPLENIETVQNDDQVSIKESSQQSEEEVFDISPLFSDIEEPKVNLSKSVVINNNNNENSCSIEEFMKIRSAWKGKHSDDISIDCIVEQELSKSATVNYGKNKKRP